MAASPLQVDRGDAPPREKWSGMDDQVGETMGPAGEPSASNGGAPDDRDHATDSASQDRNGTTVYREKQIKRSLRILQPNKVYIGGLPEHTRQEDLQSCFGKIGTIANIELKIGYGFVVRSYYSFRYLSDSPQEFESREAAEESVAKYHEGFFMGNKIRVELSHGGGRYAKFSGDPGACFKCGQMGHWARECPNHVVQTNGRRGPSGDPPLIDRIQSSRDYPPPPPRGDYPSFREDYPPRNYPPARDARYSYDYPPPRRPLSPPPRDYRDYPPAPPAPRRGEIDDFRMRGPPPPPPPAARYDSRPGYYPPFDDGGAAYTRGYPPPARDYDRYDRRPPPPGDRYAYPPGGARPRTPPIGGPPRGRDDFDRPPPRDFIPPPGDYRGRPVTPPPARYADYPPRGVTDARFRRRSQSPPPRSASAAYESYPPSATAYAGAPPAVGASKGPAPRDYPPPRGRDVVESNGGYRRP
ncbi:hypothetical protein OF83DRAFT_583250 [Amylostereum chailletii]|nr:hypothetical protein OF83DRAFT_583250 [Amylostereum chailletii]